MLKQKKVKTHFCLYILAHLLDALRAYFEQFSPVESVIIVKTPSGISRGFGFVTFYDSAVVPSLFQSIHVLDQCQVRLVLD